jgi:hypothetical protein
MGEARQRHRPFKPLVLGSSPSALTQIVRLAFKQVFLFNKEPKATFGIRFREPTLEAQRAIRKVYDGIIALLF